MASIKIPTPLRAYTGGEAVIEVNGGTVSAVLEDLTSKHPQLRQHIFEGDDLRSFVNIFIGPEDTRFLDGLETEVSDEDQLRIIPSIAGGSGAMRKVDHTALRTNQGFIIALLGAAFILDLPPLVALVAGVLLVGAVFPPLRGFVWVYKAILKPVGLLKPDVVEDNPEPHRFSMMLGGVFSGLSFIFLAGGISLGWGLSLLVIFLAALNLFLGFCAGCFMYYQFNKLGVPGFDQAPVG